MDKVEVGQEPEEQMTDLQIYGISSTVVQLLGALRKYAILAQIQKDLQTKPAQAQPVMREFYQYEETKMIMDIRTQFDMVYVYTKDKIVLKNFDIIRTSFENAISFLTENMMNVTSVTDKNYVEILDEFADKIKHISDVMTRKSIFDESFKI